MELIKQNEISGISDLVILSSELEKKYQETLRASPRPYTRVMFLSDLEYRINESFVSRIGAIQLNAYDCGPLVVYAARESKKQS